MIMNYGILRDKGPSLKNTVTFSSIKIIFILLACVVGSFHCASQSQKVTLRLCDESKPIKEYILTDPYECHQGKPAYVKRCENSTIYHTRSEMTEFSAYACQIVTSGYESTKYFFGSQQKDVYSFYAAPPTSAVCRDWVQTLRDTNLGEFTEVESGLWKTDNELDIEYYWPTSHTDQIQNGILMRIGLQIDHRSNQIIEPVHGISACEIMTGSCALGRQMLIWDVSNNLTCPNVVQLNSPINIFVRPGSKAYRLEIEELAVSVHNFGFCHESATTCFGRHALCLNNGLVVTTDTCKAFSHDLLMSNATASLYGKAGTIEDAFMASFLQELIDTSKTTLNKLSLDLGYLECVLEHHLTRIYKLLSRMYPSEVLSILQSHDRRSRSAHYLGDALIEIACQDIAVDILPSLYHKGLYGTRPIVSYMINNETHYGQIYSNGIIYPNVRYVENYKENKIQIFRIADKNYVFRNYTLSSTHVNLDVLRPTLHNIVINVDTPDYLSILESMRFDMNRLDYQNLDLALHFGSLIKEDIIKGFERTSRFKNLMNASYSLEYLGSEFRSVIQTVISLLTSPIFGAIYGILIHMAMFWGVVLTILFFKKVLPTVYEKANVAVTRYRTRGINPTAPPDDNRRDPPDNLYPALRD